MSDLGPSLTDQIDTDHGALDEMMGPPQKIVIVDEGRAFPRTFEVDGWYRVPGLVDTDIGSHPCHSP